jgi:hypothetical protein
MTNLDIVKILQIGIIGLGSLLALLAFWLLRDKQHKQASNQAYFESHLRIHGLFFGSLCSRSCP